MLKEKSMLLIFIVLSLSCAKEDVRLSVEKAWSLPVSVDQMVIASDASTETQHAHGIHGQSNGVVYLKINNPTQTADTLLSISTDICDIIEMHETKITDDVMQMERLEGGLPIPSKSTVEFKPRGLHIMLINLSQSLKNGEAFPITLNFKNAGKIEVTSHVRTQ